MIDATSGKYFVAINVLEEITHKTPINEIDDKTICVGIDL